MSQNHQPTDSVTNPVAPNPADTESPVVTTADPSADTPTTNPTPATAEDESTIGTGTSMALGCIAGTVVLIAFGLLFLFISTLV